MAFNRKLLDDMIAVELLGEPAAKGRIKLPDWQKYLRGTVIATGPGRMLPEAENPFREAAQHLAHQAEERAKTIDLEFGIHRDALAALERFSMRREEPETGSNFTMHIGWNWGRT